MKVYDVIKRPEIVQQFEKEGFEMVRVASGMCYMDCPLCGNTNKSVSIDPVKQIWACEACNKGGKIEAFYKRWKHISRSMAVEYLERQQILAILSEEEKVRNVIEDIDKGGN